MRNKLALIVLLFIPIWGISQESPVEEFVILTFEIERNKDSHGPTIYYWVAELEKYEKIDEYKEPKIYSLFLHVMGSSDQLESCCLGIESDPFTFTTISEFNYPKNYDEYLFDLRELVKRNRIKIQVIRKAWKNGYKEKVTVYATAVRGRLCRCQFNGNRYLNKGDIISFPRGNFEILKNYLTKDKWIILYKDFSDFDYANSE